MKYMILVQSNPSFQERWEALPDAERESFGRRHLALDRELAESGELIGSEALADPSPCQAGHERERAADDDHRRALRRGQGAPRRVLPGRLRRPRNVRSTSRPGCPTRSGDSPRCVRCSTPARGTCDRSQRPRGPAAALGAAASSASSCAAAATSRPPRTPSRRPSSRRRQQWPAEGVPANPTGWLVTAAYRRLVETWRSESARRRREVGYALREPPPAEVPADDDSLPLLFLCCHPVLTPSSQVALTLRALGGLTTAEIARALLVPPATVAQRISRAKATIRQAGVTFHPPADAETAQRLPSVLRVLYLIFNEGYTASEGADLHRVELTAEAIRLTRRLHDALPAEGEVAGLLALMLLTDARRRARTRPDGASCRSPTRTARCGTRRPSPRASSWSPRASPPPTRALPAAGRHRRACTTRRRRAEDTDWAQILALYEVLELLAPGPVVTLNRIVASAMVHGPAVGLGAAGRRRRRAGAYGAPPAGRRPRAPARPAGRARRGPRALPARRPRDAEPARAALSHGEGRRAPAVPRAALSRVRGS